MLPFQIKNSLLYCLNYISSPYEPMLGANFWRIILQIIGQNDKAVKFKHTVALPLKG